MHLIIGSYNPLDPSDYQLSLVQYQVYLCDQFFATKSAFGRSFSLPAQNSKSAILESILEDCNRNHANKISQLKLGTI